MPVFDQAETVMDAYNVKGMAYSGVRPDTLIGSSRYTLVLMVRDKSGSVLGHKDALVYSLKEAIKSCGYSEWANSLLIRTLDFNHNLHEVHGFKELRNIDIDKSYDMVCGGGTALYDAVANAVRSALDFGSILYDKDYDVNVVMFIFTDGEEIDSNIKDPLIVKQAIEELIQSEKIDSVVSVLVGINAGRCSTFLKNFQRDVGISSYEDVKNFDFKVGAKLAQFISKSISSQSQSLATGSQSKVIQIADIDF